MAAPTTDRPASELEGVERLASEHLGDLAPGALDAPVADEREAGAEKPSLRFALAVALPTIAAGLLVGGVFVGASARVYAVLGGLLGVAIAFVAARVRRPFVTNILIVAGLAAIGVVFLAFSAPGKLGSLAVVVRRAIDDGDVLRPPVPFALGWRVILGWLMGTVGFGAAWVALAFKRPSLGLLLPLPVGAVAAISIPERQQLSSGLVALVLFAIGLGLLSSAQAFSDDDERPPASYELRRALRALPLIAVITAALYGIAQTDLLFPPPFVDPANEAQRPKVIPPSEVPDRVLFTVQARISGPWRTGSLDVYDGKDWRLAPFAESSLNEVPKSGVVDADLEPGVKATFEVAGLGGAVLPGLPNTVGIVAKGPQLSYDDRNGNIRVTNGSVRPGLDYTVTAAAVPAVSTLRAVRDPIPPALRQFTEIPPAPAGIQDLLDRANRDYSNQWDRLDFLRNLILNDVVASGAGAPVSITPERVQDMLIGSKKGSPYEIVAAQAMLARWLGIPSRIGYGFDGGEEVEPGRLEVRPRNGASFLEVWFPSYKWLPVIGVPKHAEPTVGDTDEAQTNPNILPSDEIQAQVYLPIVVAPKSPLAENVRRAVFALLALALLAAFVYFTWPALLKAVVRSRRRTKALADGPAARVALAYSEWRDYCTDLGYRYPTDTPLMFLDRFAPDAEHTELAWLVTRGLWGDMRGELTPAHATAAEEISRALRKRLAEVHPATVRAVGAVSRLSLRAPYSTDQLFQRDPRARRRRLRRAKEKGVTDALPA